MSKIHWLTAAAAAATLISTPVSAQDKNTANAPSAAPLDAGEVSAAVRYALPHLFKGMRNRCTPLLPSDGFLAMNGDRLYAKFSEGADESWAVAREMVMEMVSEDEEDSGVADAFAQMPDEALQPFVNALLPTIVSAEMKDEDCADFERILVALDPLPADNFAELVGVLVALADRDDGDEEAGTTETSPE